MLSTNQKYTICRIILIIGAIAIVFCLVHLSPYASPHHNKVWFAVAMVSVVIAVPCDIGASYYKRESLSATLDEVATQTLSKLDMSNPDKTAPKPTSPATDSPTKTPKYTRPS